MLLQTESDFYMNWYDYVSTYLYLHILLSSVFWINSGTDNGSLYISFSCNTHFLRYGFAIFVRHCEMSSMCQHTDAEVRANCGLNTLPVQLKLILICLSLKLRMFGLVGRLFISYSGV